MKSGLMLMGGGVFPHTGAQLLGSTAHFLSSINLVGGVLITQRMLDMFKREDDPEEYNWLYGVPAIASVAGYGYLSSTWCSKRENFNHISYITQITRISVASLLHIIRKSLE